MSMGKSITPKEAGAPDFIELGYPGLSSLRSDKDTHFTESLAKNASEQESIAGLETNRINLTGVSIQAKQALHYRLLFFSSADFTDSDLDVDTFIGSVDLDLPQYGIEVNVKATE